MRLRLLLGLHRLLGGCEAETCNPISEAAIHEQDVAEHPERRGYYSSLTRGEYLALFRSRMKPDPRWTPYEFGPPVYDFVTEEAGKPV